MKNLFFVIIALTSVFLANSQQTKIKHVDSAEFKELLAKNDGTLLDVRTSYEFDSGHIKDADQLNYYAFSFKDDLLLLPKDKPIYLYCRTGYRSNKTAKILIENGYEKVYNLQHGIKDWEQKKHSTVKDTEE